MSIQRVIGKFIILLLCLTAMYTTASSITNMSFVEFKEYWITSSSHVEAAHAPTVVGTEEATLQEKKMNTFIEGKTYISSDQVTEQRTLEEAIDFNQYTTEKVLATGYTAGVESTGKHPEHPEYGITYSGVKVKRDLYSTIAADLNVFPLGTILYIPDYGYGVVADIGGAIDGNKIDLYFDTVEDVYAQWGKKEVEVYVVERGNGTLSEEVMTQLNEDEVMQVFRNQMQETF